MSDILKMNNVIASLKEARQTALVLGGTYSGKTQYLIDYAASLLDAGAAPDQIVMLAASPDAAARLAARLAARHVDGDQVRVTVARQLFLDILALSQARLNTRRDARLLAPFEVDFVMEDLKVSGVRSGRLREMVKFFLRGMTELADWDEGWLVSVEEKLVYGLLKDSLAFSGGVLEQELGNIALRYLMQSPEALEQVQVPHVLVDDFQQLSRASQMLARLLATGSLTVAADEGANLAVFESYPYAEGTAELRNGERNLIEVQLIDCWSCEGAQRAHDELRCDPALGEADGNGAYEPGYDRQADRIPVVASAATPADEMAAVVNAVCEALETGTAAGDIVIAAPHGVWRANAARALEKQGVPVELAASDRGPAGDVRDLGSCHAARVLTALYLAADPESGVAWRSWCGFGDYLTRSDDMHKLRERYAPNGYTLAEALKACGGEGADFAQLAQAHEAGLALVDSARGLKGDALLMHLAAACGDGAQDVPFIVRQLTAPFADGSMPGEGASDLAARARRRLSLPSFERDGCVRVMPFERLVGQTPRVLVACGMVNGFMPVRAYFDRVKLAQDKADKLYEHDVRLLAWSLAKASSNLLVTCFDRIELEAAERLKLKLSRVRLDDQGRRIGLVGSSVLLDNLL